MNNNIQQMVIHKNKLSIGVDCGGSHIHVVLIQNGSILAEKKFQNHNEKEDLNRIKRSISALCNEMQVGMNDILGIGISLPGIVDFFNGRLVSLKQKYEWGINFNFKAWAEENFNSLPVVVENDARLALLGEVSYGVAKGSENAVLFMPGTGIGTSAIIEGKLLRGVHFRAGILGAHLGTDIHGFACNCGGIGCLEAQVGSWQLANRLRKSEGFETSVLSKVEILDYKSLFEAYKADDTFAVRSLEEILALWGAGLVNLVHAYDPKAIVFTGGVMQSSNYIIPPLIEYVKRYSWSPYVDLDFVVADNVNISPLLGTEALLKKHLDIALIT